MRLSEIDYTAGVELPPYSLEQMAAASTVVGDLDFEDVFLFTSGIEEVFFTNSDNRKGAITLQGDRLRGVANYTNTPGLITMLVGFVTHRLNRKIYIDEAEPLTNSGITWLCKLLRAKGRGLTITDQNGNFPDADQVYAEWEHFMSNHGHGPTRIYIEGAVKGKRHMLLTKAEMLKENTLIWPRWFIGDENIL
jgi:hypothetical protein